jgi:GTP-binding protein
MRVVRDELDAYGAGLTDKPQLIALNKIDLVDTELTKNFAAELIAAGATQVFPISGATGEGVSELLDAVIERLPAATVTERPAGEAEVADESDWSPL